MTDLRNNAFNLCPVFFGRLGMWFLTGPSLAEFCVNRRVAIENKIHVGVYGIERDFLISKFGQFNLALVSGDDPIIVRTEYGIDFHIELFADTRKGQVRYADREPIPKEWLSCSAALAEEIRQKNPFMKAGMWSIPLSETETIEFKVPFYAGHYLDSQFPGWFLTIKERNPDAWRITDVFFDEQRCLNGIELIGQMYECARKAEICDRLFIGYGTLLGFVRHGSFIPSDRDMDMCLLMDGGNVRDALRYVDLCKEAGLGEHRWAPPQCRSDTGMPLWFSLGPKNPVSESGVKSCNWFWFSHGGYWWHSKGGLWVSPSKFSQKKTQYKMTDAAIAKGIPQDCLSRLIDAEFQGIKVRVPDKTGHCLDCWYPGWPIKREGASAHEWLMVIEKWENKGTWRIG